MVEFCGSLRESGVIASTAEKAASLRSAASPLVQRSSGAAAWAVLTVAQASMHRPHCVQENIQRFRLRGFRRIGQTASQALPWPSRQVAHSASRERSVPTTRARRLLIQARLCRMPTEQP